MIRKQRGIKSTLEKIQYKPTKFKVCDKCEAINWHKNKKCVDCSSTKFIEEGDMVEERIQREYKFWTRIEKLNEKDTNKIVYVVR